MPLKAREIIRKLRQVGFLGPIAGGKHVRMVHPATGNIIPIPMHKGKDVSVGLIREIINQAGLSREDWEEL